MRYLKKSLGQNFLIDKNIIRKIVNLVDIKNKNVIEIGPGDGALTDEILRRDPESLSIIEKDNHFAQTLKKKYSKIKYIKIYNSDVLKFDVEKLSITNSVIFGNLPYNISSQILIKILNFKKWPPNFSNLVLMFQKELADKIIGKYKTRDYGRLSIISNLRLDIIEKFLVSPNCFFPKPKVNSIVINFRPKLNKSFKIKNIKNLEKVTNVLFSSKRKMINKNIRKILKDNQIKNIKNFNINSRPAEIKPEIYYKITEMVEGKGFITFLNLTRKVML